METLNKQLKGHRTLVFLDFEGTQFSHEIIAIGAVKVKIHENGKINKFIRPKKFKVYVKCLGQIGKIVYNLTHIDEPLLREQGIPFDQALTKLKTFIHEPLETCTYVTFGSNDAKMILDSIALSKPSNADIGYTIVKNIVDYLQFISQFIKDNNGSNYSLVNYLNVFGVKPHGESHDPLNDAYDLMKLYDAVEHDKDTLLKEYLKVLQKQKGFPTPVKKAIQELSNGKDVSSKKFIEDCEKYLK